MTPALRFSHVCKAFGRVGALVDVTLEVDGGGQLFALVGANGAGKTTLIKCLLDLVAPDAGTIEIGGIPHRDPRSRWSIAYLPERFSPPAYLTGHEYLAAMQQFHRAEFTARESAAACLALDLDPVTLSRPLGALSKGMTQKVGLAATLLADKALLVLDEPMSGLDAKARALLKRELRAVRSRGATVFFTSHTLSDVDELCDGMAVLDAGELRFCGAPAQLRERHGGSSLEDAFLMLVA